MIAVVQRVKNASVKIEDEIVGTVGKGVLVLLGVEKNDSNAEADYLSKKIVELRIFQDRNDKMNLSLLDVGGEILIVSQFTLLADCRKGRRPSFNGAAPPTLGNQLYEYFVESISQYGLKTATGIFGAMMQVSLINDGPVTLFVESRKYSGERLVLPGIKSGVK